MAVHRGVAAGSAASAATFLSTFFREAAVRGPALALRRLSERLRPVPVSIWCDCIRQLLDCDRHQGLGLLESALSLHAADADLLCLKGQTCLKTGDVHNAELAFRRALASESGHSEAAFAYARLLRDAGRYRAAAKVLLALSQHGLSEADALSSAEFLSGCHQRHEAYAICLAAIESGSKTAALSLEAGTLALALGLFEAATEHLRDALKGPTPEWGASLPLSLCRRFRSPDDPDLQTVRELWANADIPDSIRITSGFALGKILDDLGDFSGAADVLRDANVLASAEYPWSPRNWNDFIDIQLTLEPASLPASTRDDSTPIFIVGLPRTGTTLVAELLGRHPSVSNRGELNWISFIAERLAITRGFGDRNSLAQAAELYRLHLRRDDAPARFYIDKNPLNFRHLGLISAMFPNARIIHCCRDPRDTALSIWSQCFDHAENAYAYRFDHIEAFMRGHERLMTGLIPRMRSPVFRLQYENLIQSPEQTLSELAEFVGLDGSKLIDLPEKTDRHIGTASVWQARQQIYSHGVSRWPRYAPFLPELARLGDSITNLSISSQTP